MTLQSAISRSSRPARPEHPLRAWRKQQLVTVAGCRRSMRLIDVERLYGIPKSTWAGWEQWPGEPGFRRPDDDNLARLHEITRGEITPNAFYPVQEWEAALAAESGG